MTRPIKRLQRRMLEAETGNLETTFPVETLDEIGQLGASFNRMLARLREVIAQVYEKQDQLRQAELKAIQAQFNPHFLYNALDSINWMARLHDVNEISEMTLALGELLRFSIRNDVEMITVRDEMRLIRNYLTIQRMRNRDKFETIIELEPKIEQYYTPKLLLQPIVENAVIHGLWKKTSRGTLRVTGKKENDRLKFVVEDDGIGFPATLERGADGIRPNPANGTTGIGLANIRRRLQLHFGANHEFWIKSVPGRGTKVGVEIPVVTEAKAIHAFNFARR